MLQLENERNSIAHVNQQLFRIIVIDSGKCGYNNELTDS